MANSVDITALNQKLGEYCRDKKAELFSGMLLDQSFQDRFHVMDDVTDELVLPRLDISDFLKPALPGAFRPTPNALKFSARILKVRSVHGDLTLVPEALEKSWLGQFKSQGSNPTDMPFEEYLMNYIAKSARNQLHLKGVYKGIHNANGTSPSDMINGWLKLVVDAIAAGDISETNKNLVETGAITKANVIDSLEKIYDGIDEPYKAMDIQMLVAPTIYDWYNRAYRSEFGANNNYGGMEKNAPILLDGTNCYVYREPGLTGSQRVICSVKENMCYGVDSISDINTIRTKEQIRSIDVALSFKAGVEFRQLDGALVVNECA